MGFGSVFKSLQDSTNQQADMLLSSTFYFKSSIETFLLRNGPTSSQGVLCAQLNRFFFRFCYFGICQPRSGAGRKIKNYDVSDLTEHFSRLPSIDVF